MRKILGALRRADERFGMIADGDTIAVGFSGGKDSALLLYALKLYRLFSKKDYALKAVCVDLGFGNYDTKAMRDYADRMQVELSIIKTDIAEIVFDIRKEKNPCALCSKMRKGALYERAKELGCNKAAFAHHADDAVQTLMLSLTYEARFNTFSPVTYLSRRDITLVRPLILAREYDIRAAVKRNNIPISKNPCPADGGTKREESKAMLAQMNKMHPGFSDNLVAALANTDAYNLWDRKHH